MNGTAGEQAAAPGPVRVGILIYAGCDLLDLGGPYEALLTADRLLQRAERGERIEVVTLGVGTAPLRAYGGLGLVPHLPADDAGHLDAVVVPGTVEVAAALDAPALIATVEQLAARARLVTSVCTGSFLLAAAGLLEGRRATTHHEDLPALAARGDVGTAVAGARVVVDGELMTAGGLSCGLDLGLDLVAHLVDEALATATAAQLAHPYTPATAPVTKLGGQEADR